MASVTLAQSALLAQDELVAGVIENIITVNRMFEVLPFDGIEGNSLAYNRELVLGDVEAIAIDTTIAANAAATFSQVTSTLTTLLGDAQVSGLIQATRSGDGNDQTAVQIASKAKSLGREYQDQFITGDGVGANIEGLLSLLDGAQTTDTGVNGSALTFKILDETLDLVQDKDGQVDFLTMHARTLRSYFELLRNQGGATIGETVTLPSGTEVPAYRGVPIFRNDYLPINQTKGSGSDQTTIFAGTLDDGSRSHGIAGLTASQMAGIRVVDVGESETKDNHVWRIRWYAGLANFSVKGLAGADGITD